MAKTYLVKVNGALTAEQEEQFRQGIPLRAADRASRAQTDPRGRQSLVRGAPDRGTQNQIRMMFKHFGRLVEKLRRVRIGFLELGPLKPGQFRTLTPAEVARFRKLLKLEEA